VFFRWAQFLNSITVLNFEDNAAGSSRNAPLTAPESSKV
jgi:hypothetical protein